MAKPILHSIYINFAKLRLDVWNVTVINNLSVMLSKIVSCRLIYIVSLEARGWTDSGYITLSGLNQY